MVEPTISNLQKTFLQFKKSDLDICFLEINGSVGRISEIIKEHHESGICKNEKTLKKLEWNLSNIINNLIHISNILEIDLETCIFEKEKYNSVRYCRDNFIDKFYNNLTIGNFMKSIFTYEKSREEDKLHIRFMYKLIEEVGELSKVIKDNLRASNTGSIKGTIEEELHDVFYYVLCILNEFNLRYDYSLLMYA